MPFKFTKLEIPELILIEPQVFEDERGLFMESYKESEFIKAGIKERLVQENHSKSKKGVLRGLHYQKNPNAQGKLVRCIKGKIFDVAVDLRKNLDTYGKWVGIILSEENKRMVYVPPSFAHGFCVLSEDSEVIYKTTNEYSHEDERGILWEDKNLNIEWPIKNPILNHKDKNNQKFKMVDNNF